MKIRFLVLSLLLAATAVFGQVSPNSLSLGDEAFNDYFLNPNNIPKVRGKLINLAASEATKYRVECHIVTPFHEMQTKRLVPVAADGSFEIKLDYAFPFQQIWIAIDDLFYTGVFAHRDLYIELDVPALKSRGEEDAYYHGVGVKYLGTDGALNEYINRHRLYRREDQLEMSKQLSSLVFSTRTNQDTFSATFRPKYDSLHAVLHELDEAFIKENPSEFARLIRNERLSRYYGDLCVVHWGEKMDATLFEKMIAHKPYVVSNNGMILHSYLLTYLKSTIHEANVTEASLRIVRLLDSLFAPPQADYFKIKLSSNDTKERKLITEAILPHINTAWCRSIVQEEYDKALAKSKRMDELVSKSGQSTNKVTPLGKPIAELSFGAKLYKIDKMGAEQLMSLLKNSFKNTAMLVDCWATWCSPCIAEFPHSKILHEDCQDLPLEFVYICTSEGTDLETWKRRIVDYELKGTHIFLERSTAFALLESLSFSGYPSYFILNTRGEYVSMNNQRPSRLSKQTLSKLIK